MLRLANTVATPMARNIVTVYYVDYFVLDKERKPYVANRVKLVHWLTSRDLWRHCPVNLNLADLPSRGLSGD